MPSYEIVEHSVEGTGERHFFRVAVWYKTRRTPLPDVYAEFLLHPGPEHDPLGPIIPVIENRVAYLADHQDQVSDEFNRHELKQFNMRTARKRHPIESHISRNAVGMKGKVERA